jgi:hypothetical protein
MQRQWTSVSHEASNYQFLLGPFASVVVIVDVQEAEDTILWSAAKALEPRSVRSGVLRVT